MMSLLLGLSACMPGIPDVGLPEAASEGLVQQLNARREGMSNLSALARLRMERKGRKRAFDSVGVLVAKDKGLKIEAYDPLGAPLVTLLWQRDAEPLVSIGGERAVNAGGFGVERLLGMSIDLRDLMAVLTGNVPEDAVSHTPRVFCDERGRCVVEARHEGIVRRSWLDIDSGRGSVLRSYELYNSGRLAFRARFENLKPFSGRLMPMRIEIENPERKVALTIEYEDVELNSPMGDDLFYMPDEEAP